MRSRAASVYGGTEQIQKNIIGTPFMIMDLVPGFTARIALARRMLGCLARDQPLRPWGHARERTIRDLGGALLTIRPDRALCTGCGASHVMLDAGLLPRRAYAAGLIGQALAASALGHGHRPIAAGLAVPAGTARLDPRRPPVRHLAAHHRHPRRPGLRPR
jgi:hypothetical protein